MKSLKVQVYVIKRRVPVLQGALQGAADAGTLRTLRVLCSEAPSSIHHTTANPNATVPPPSHNMELELISSMTSLRRLSIEGQRNTCMFLRALAPLQHLTALELSGTEACKQAACEAGSWVRQLRSLHQLNLSVVWQGSNPLAAAHACTATCISGAATDCCAVERDFAAVERGFWAGMWAATTELPLHHGARGSFRKGCTCVAEML